MFPVYTVTNTRAAVDKIKYCERTHTHKKGLLFKCSSLASTSVLSELKCSNYYHRGLVFIGHTAVCFIRLCSAEEWINEAI